MTWVTIFDGVVMGDHIKVQRYVDEDSEEDYPVRVKATDKNPPQITPPIVEEGAIMIPLPPHNPNHRFTFDYDNINDMYNKFASDSGSDTEFTDALEKAILGN